MTKRRKKKTEFTPILISKTIIAYIFVICWLMFFFSYYFVYWSLIYNIFSVWVEYIFWWNWKFMFYFLIILLWIYLIINKNSPNRWLFKKTIILMILFSIILCFPILENQTLKPQDLWWYIWYFFLWTTMYLFSEQIESVRIFYMWLTLFYILYFLYSIWFIHNLNIKWIIYNINVFKFIKFQDSKPIKEIINTNDKESKQKIQVNQFPFKENNNEENQSLNEQKTTKIDIIKKINNEEEIINQPEQINNTNNLLKIIFKNKFNEKIENKLKNQNLDLSIKFKKDIPSFDVKLLDMWEWQSPGTLDEQFIIEKSKSLEIKLKEFWIDIEIVWYKVWPTVIQIEFKPNAWIKLSKIENLKKDLSLAMKTKSLRIIAPIPWTEFVWIELPNPKPQMVRLRDVLDSKEFKKSMQENYTNMSLWKWIDWSINIKPLEKMPHVLIAWATGSGKSVWVNDFILSLIFQNDPNSLKFIMIDPKQVELWIYEWIPYLLSPIITEPAKAIKVLKWAVEYMNIRYKNLKDIKVRNIDEYNEKVSEQEKMYRLVIIIDELADLMMSWNKKDTENSIARIAQMARAVWIHLILATQRPSVNVITWIIKANIPTRIAFWVVSQIDSRTILDYKWAEDLVWKWDLLYLDPSNKNTLRIQAPYVSTYESEKIVEFLMDKYMKWVDPKNVYHPEIIKILESKVENWWIWDSDEWWSDDEDLVQRAIETISQTKKASATLLQRKLWIWFARAARIMDILEERWVVWPQDWAKAREIFL